MVRLGEQLQLFDDQRGRRPIDHRGGETPPFDPQQYAVNFGAPAWRREPALILEDGQTLESNFDLVSSAGENTYAFVSSGRASKGEYFFFKSGTGLILFKRLPASPIGAWMFWDAVSTKNQNVRIGLALTRSGDRLWITARVYDLDDNLSILYERTLVDGPGVDPSINSPDVTGTETTNGIVSEADPGPPYFEYNLSGIGMWRPQEGHGEIVLDNYTHRLHGPPELGIASAIRLRFPASPLPFVVEGAPTVDGPWQIVDEPMLEVDGFTQMTVPTTDSMRCFRLRNTLE